MKPNLFAGIPEQYTRFVQLPNEKGHNAVWDFRRSPHDRFYISVCGENEKPLTALLYEYYPTTGELRKILDVEKVWIVDPDQMPPSKIHTSIDFLPDGRLIMATHNTAPARSHKQWLYEQHYEDIWEGYPGSIVMIVNPDTNEVQIKGIPVPRESIYGGILGNDPRYYYFLGYMRGHFYRLDLETNEVIDYGKVSEFSSCRLVKDNKGRIYGSSYTGGMWRYEPVGDRIVDLKLNFISPNGTRYRRQFIFALTSPKGTLFLVNNLDGEMIELHPETLEVTRHGPIHLRDLKPLNAYGIGGLEADENFILYYGLKTYDEYMPIRLVRWDILKGGEPENLGLIAPAGKDSQYICEMIFDRNGWLHMVDVCGEYSPYILAVDVKKLEPPTEEKPKLVLRPYMEPDYNGVGQAAFMYIEAETIRTLPLHQHMDWCNTAVKHMRTLNGKLYCISGKEAVYLTESNFMGDRPLQIRNVYEGGAPVSCTDINDFIVAVLTTNRKIVYVDLEAGSIVTSIALPSSIELTKLHCQLNQGKLLASDRDGALYACDLDGNDLSLFENIRIEYGDSHIIPINDTRILLSGSNDEIWIYDTVEMYGNRLDVKTPSVKGRAFKARITGGSILVDGTIVAGTHDGILFSLSPDLQKTTTYGRLHSTGQLRNFIKRNGEEVIGIYGGIKDAGHVFHFSRDIGFVDLGKPRVIKDNIQLADIDSEWANIHYISCLTYVKENDQLCVASGEEYGCVIQYKGVVF